MGLQRTLHMIRNLRNWPEYLLYKAGGRKAESFTFRLRNGRAVQVPRAVQPEFKECVFEMPYFMHLGSAFPLTGAPVVVDVGANVGYFSLAADLCFPRARIIAFEPIPQNFALLQVNTGELSPERFTAVHGAVAGQDGELVLRYDSGASITTSASIFENPFGAEEIRVPAVSLPGLMKQFGLSRIDLLKLDCEGAEYEILYNTPAELFNQIGAIAMETHKGPDERQQNEPIAQYLRKLGYQVQSKPDAFIWAWR